MLERSLNLQRSTPASPVTSPGKSKKLQNRPLLCSGKQFETLYFSPSGSSGPLCFEVWRGGSYTLPPANVPTFIVVVSVVCFELLYRLMKFKWATCLRIEYDMGVPLLNCLIWCEPLDSGLQNVASRNMPVLWCIAHWTIYVWITNAQIDSDRRTELWLQ